MNKSSFKHQTIRIEANKISIEEAINHTVKYIELLPNLVEQLHNTSIPNEDTHELIAKGYIKSLINFNDSQGMDFKTCLISSIKHELILYLREKKKGSLI